MLAGSSSSSLVALVQVGLGQGPLLISAHSRPCVKTEGSPEVLSAADQTNVAFRDRASQLLREVLGPGAFRGHDFSQPLAAVEALTCYGALQPEVWGSFRSQIYAPALPRLLRLKQVGGEGGGGGDGVCISDRDLERRFGLGPFTSAAMFRLGLSCSGESTASWPAAARRFCRSHCQEDWHVFEDAEPSAQAVLAWNSVAASEDAACSRGVVSKSGAGLDVADAIKLMLKPVFADHDRSGHAERAALLNVLSSLMLRVRSACLNGRAAPQMHANETAARVASW